jgi:hypothetical protein
MEEVFSDLFTIYGSRLAALACHGSRLFYGYEEARGRGEARD